MTTELVERAAAIWRRAAEQYNPYAVVMMFSGGSDSTAAYEAARRAGVPLTHILHGRTGTGIPETTEYARRVGQSSGLVYLEADAGDAYERYVLRKGFFGRGETAHNYAYHTLKAEHFRKALSRGIRQGRRGRSILLINGARAQESSARGRKIPAAIRADGPNVWVSLIHDWNATEKRDFLAETGSPINPVTQTLCRSGECMCGTTQSQAVRAEAAYWYPRWGRWLDDLERRVMARFPWRWGDDVPSWFAQTQRGQLSLGADFLPMCHSCINAMGDT